MKATSKGKQLIIFSAMMSVNHSNDQRGKISLRVQWGHSDPGSNQ